MSFFNNVSQWIIGIQPDSDEEDIQEVKSASKLIVTDLSSENISTNKVDSTNEEIVNPDSVNVERPKKLSLIEEDDDFKMLDDAAIAAINLAKNIGGSIFNIGKKATEQIYYSAVQLKNIVENTPVLESFTIEQEKFLGEIDKRRSNSELTNQIAELPWFGYNEGAVMKTLILGICKDQNNFLNDSDKDFIFDYDSNYPTAMLMLHEDPMLESMRFKLVPKFISEKSFWKNYFYKIFLIKQSVQLSSLTKNKKLDDYYTNDNETMGESNQILDDKTFEFISNKNDCDIPASEKISFDINKDSSTNGRTDYYQLADWEQELVNELSDDPMLMSDAVKIPEDVEKELLMELQEHLKISQAAA